MILTELLASGVNKSVEWLEKNLQKQGYDTRVSFAGSNSKQYLHVISGTDSLTIRVLDPTLPQGKHQSMKHDYTVVTGTKNMPAKQKKKLRLNKPNTTTDLDKALNHVKSILK